MVAVRTFHILAVYFPERRNLKQILPKATLRQVNWHSKQGIQLFWDHQINGVIMPAVQFLVIC